MANEHPWHRAWREAKAEGPEAEAELARGIAWRGACAAKRRLEELTEHARMVEERRCECGATLHSTKRVRCTACALRRSRRRS